MDICETYRHFGVGSPFMNYKNLHRTTGILISVFIVAHLFNHSMAWFGIQTHREIMRAFRKVYRQPVIEVFLIGAFLFQAYSGLSLLFALKKKANLSLSENFQFYSGIVLGFFIIQHIGAVIGQRLYYQFDTDFYFAARVVIEFPINLYFVPYYFTGIVAFGIHVGAAHRQKISQSVKPRVATIHFVLIVSVSVLLACIILYTFMGGRFPISIPEQYKVY